MTEICRNVEIKHNSINLKTIFYGEIQGILTTRIKKGVAEIFF